MLLYSNYQPQVNYSRFFLFFSHIHSHIILIPNRNSIILTTSFKFKFLLLLDRITARTKSTHRVYIPNGVFFPPGSYITLCAICILVPSLPHIFIIGLFFDHGSLFSLGIKSRTFFYTHGKGVNLIVVQ